MRLLCALTDAMRTRRSDRIGPTQADQLVSGDRTHPQHRGLGDLLDAAKAPGTSRELAGEQAAVAAFSAAYNRAAAPKGKDRARVRRSARRVVVTITTSLALLALTGTAVTARAGSLPDHAQQHAHRLFSALGVPAPRTGPTNPVSHPKPTARPSTTPAPTSSPSSPAAIPLGWCRKWQAQPSGKALDAESRRRLTDAAGGEEKIDEYCADLSAGPSTPTSGPPSAKHTPKPSAPTAASPSGSGSASASPGPPGPGNTRSPGKPSGHPTPPVLTPSHPHK
jgi:hypothetical protein